MSFLPILVTLFKSSRCLEREWLDPKERQAFAG
jgi:hypothetical protein